MRRALLLLAVVGAAAVLVTGAESARSAKTRLVTFKVTLVQEQTVRHHNSADGDNHVNDTFSTSLRLFAIGKVLGFPDKTPMGRMAFNWGPLSGSCSSSASSCNGTTNINTVTKLPGGTITAGGNHVSLSKGIVVPVQSGTGVFKGATGTIAIAPASVAEDVFTLRLPA
jgi:hypothetical protein